MMRPDRAADLLKRFDKNGDGKLDEDELAEAHEAMLQEQMARRTANAAAPDAAKMRERALAMFDKDHDGRLSDEERAEMQRQLQEFRPVGPGAGPNRAALLRRFDKNADGKIDDAEMAELEKTVRPLMELSPEQLRRHDKNGDGKLDDAEWVTVREEISRWVNSEPAGAVPGVSGNAKAEQVRLERVAEEVRRRRAERERIAVRFAAGAIPPAAPAPPSAEQLPVMTEEERAQLTAMDREVARRAALREKLSREKAAK